MNEHQKPRGHEPRPAMRLGRLRGPFRITEQQDQLHVSEAVFGQIGDTWRTCQARRFIPFP
jgi:hypothetical protein